MPADDDMDRSSLLTTSQSQCLSGSTFPDSDTGYFGSSGLYEGSCDHLERDYGRRYSVEMIDDAEVFTDESAWTACSPTTVDDFVAASSENRNAVQGGLKSVEFSNEEQLDVAGVDVSLGSHHTARGKTVASNDTVAGTDLSDDSLKICQGMHLSADVSVSDQPPSAEMGGLSEVAGKYATVQLLLEISRQRADVRGAEHLMLDCSLPGGCESSASVDRKAMALLAADYPVINECLQLGRVTSKMNKSGDNVLHFKTPASDTSHMISEKQQAVEKSADVLVNITAVKDVDADLSYDDHGRKDSAVTDVAEPIDRCVSYELMTPEVLVARNEPSLMYVATERPHYYPVYSRLRDFESGVLNASPRTGDNAEVRYGYMVASAEVEQIPRNFSCATDQASDHYAAETIQYLAYHDSLALLHDVESGKIPSHREADIHSTLTLGKTSSKQKVEEHVNVLEAETVENNCDNQELSDANRRGLVDMDNNSREDGFTVVETKGHRRQRKKRDFEGLAMENSSLPQSSAVLNKGRLTVVLSSDADAEAIPRVEPIELLEGEQSRLPHALSSDVTEEVLVQNSLEEINPDVDDIAATERKSPTETADTSKSEEFSSLLLNDVEMKIVQDRVAEDVVMGVVPEHDVRQQSELVEASLDVTVPIRPVTADRHEDAPQQQLARENLSDDVVPADVETLPINVAEDGEAELPVYTAVGLRAAVDSDDVAALTGRTIAVELQTEAVAVKQRAEADSSASSSNETVRVERLTTAAPRSVIRVTGELYSNVSDEAVADTVSARVSSLMTENVAPLENMSDEFSAQSIVEASLVAGGCDPALREERIKVDVVDDNNLKEVSKAVTVASDLEISENAGVEKKSFETEIAKVSCMLCEEVKTEKAVAHYTSLASLADVESGKVHNRLKASRFLREWDAENVDDIVAYIVGSGTTKHRRKHRRVKRASESEYSEVKATETGSEIVRFSMPRAKSEENIACIDEQPDLRNTMGIDVEEQTTEDDTEGGSFTVVESRKHKRLRQRHDSDEVWAQYLDGEDASSCPTEQAKIESSAGSLCGQDYNDIKGVLDSAAVSLDAEEVVDVSLEAVKMSNGSVIETVAKPVAFASDGEMETVNEALDTESRDATESLLAAEFACKHERDAQLDSLAADVSETLEPVAESTAAVVPQRQIEIHEDAEVLHPPSSVTEPNRIMSLKATESVQVVPLIDGRLYSDVARGKYDGDEVVTEPWRETATDLNVELAVGMDVINEHVEAMMASPAELPTESGEDIWPKSASEMECESFNSLVTYSLETITDIDDTGEFVDESIKDVQEVTVASDTHDGTWPDVGTTEKIAQPTEHHPLEVPFTKQVVELHSTEPSVAQQQPKAVHVVEESVSLVDMKPDVKLSQYDVTVPLTEVTDAELPLSARDDHILPTDCHFFSAESLHEPSDVESDGESHALICRMETSDVETVSEATIEHAHQLTVLELPASCSVTEVLSELSVELAAAKLRSTEEPTVLELTEEAASETFFSASSAETTREPTVDLPVTDVPVHVSEDEQHVARLFSEGLRAVQIRSDSAAAAGTVITDEVDKPIADGQVDMADSRNEDASKKSVLSSVEGFVAEILPYYYAALSALQDVERGTVQLPCDLSLQSVSNKTIEMSHGIVKPSTTSDFTVSAGDQGLSDAVPVEKSPEVDEFVTEKETGMQETVLSDVSQPCAAVVPSARIGEYPVELADKTVGPTAVKYLQSGLETCSAVDTEETRLLDHNGHDVVTLQCHRQSLKLLRSVETGHLPLLSAQLAACSGQGSAVVERAPGNLSTEQFEEKSADNFNANSECKVSSPVRDGDVNVMCDEHWKQPTAGIELCTSDILAADNLTPAALLAEHDDVEISSADNLSELQSMSEYHTEHDNITLSSDRAHVSSECGSNMPSSSLLTGELASELLTQTVDNAIEVDVRGSQRDVSFPQDDGGVDSCVTTTGVTSDSMQCHLSQTRDPLSQETVSTHLTEQIASDVCICDSSLQPHFDAGRLSTEQYANQDVSCFNEPPLSDKETINVQMSVESKTSTTQEQPEEHTKKKRKNRKKKPKSTNEDAAHLAASPGTDYIPAVNENNTVGDIVTETCFSPAAEPRSIDVEGVPTTALASFEAPASSSPKKNKKRKRTKKGRKEATDNMGTVEETDASQTVVAAEVQSIVGEVDITDRTSEEPKHSCTDGGNFEPVLPPVGMSCSESVELPSTTIHDDIADGFQFPDKKPSIEESMPIGSRADVASTSAAEENNAEKPAELCTRSVDAEVSDSTRDGKSTSSTKPVKRKNRKKRKPKTSQDTAVADNDLHTVHDNSVLQDSLTDNREELENVVVPEVDEIMTESLEEDTKITEQPLDIFCMDDSKETSELFPLRRHPPVSETAGKRKKKRKAKASKVVSQCAAGGHSSEFVTESLRKAKDDLSENDKISVPSESEAADFSTATSEVPTKELDNGKACLVSSRDEERKEAEAGSQVDDVVSHGESSSDESILRESHPTELVADSTAVSASSEKRKKKRKRNWQKKISQKAACTEAEADTDVFSLLSRIVEICSETRDDQTVADGNQPPSCHEPDKHGTTQRVLASKAARKPRKYKRSKPIRLPPDILERPPAEHMSSCTDDASADILSATRTSQLPGVDHPQMRPAALFSEETRPEFHETGEFTESPSQPTSAEDAKNSRDVADHPTMIQNAEETESVIAWSASTSKTTYLSSQYLQPRSLSHSDLENLSERRMTNESDSEMPRTLDNEDAVADRDFLTIRPSDVAEAEPQETCPDDERKATTSDDSQHSVIDHIRPVNIAGCLTADVFAVISANTDEMESSGDAVNFTSEPNDDRLTDVIRPVCRQPPKDGDCVEILDQNSNPLWFDGDGLLQVPASGCETSSVDLEVERIFAGGQVCFDADEEGACRDSAKGVDDDDDDELALEEDDYVVTEYVDVEIIEETETVTVLDNGDELSAFVSDRHCPELPETPPLSKHVISGVSPSGAAGRVQETTEDDMQLPPYSFRLHENEDEYQFTGLPSAFSTESAKASAINAEDGSARYGRGGNYHPEWFSKCSTAGDGFRWTFPFTDPAPSSDITQSRRFSRKRKHASEDTASSDSGGDDKHGSGGSQFIIAEHQPTAEPATFAPYPVWPFFAGDTHPWSTSDEMIGDRNDAAFVSERKQAGESIIVSRPPGRLWCHPAAAGPFSFDLNDGSGLIRRESDSPRDAEDLSGDSLNERGSPADGGFFKEFDRTFAESSDRAHPGCGEAWESCSTDSLDAQTKTGPTSELRQRRRSSTDCVSEDSLAEAGMDRGDSAMNTGSSTAECTNSAPVAAQAAGEQGRNTGHCRVSARPKRFGVVRAKFKCSKPGVDLKKSRKRKLGNAVEGSGSGDTDSESAELE